jgi:hypothetical protein
VQSSFLVKRESGRVQFSAEKYNLMAKNSFKYQGIANDKAVDIAQYYTDKEKKNPKGITLSTKSAKGINAPVRHLPFSSVYVLCGRREREDQDCERQTKSGKACCCLCLGDWWQSGHRSVGVRGEVGRVGLGRRRCCYGVSKSACAWVG